MDGVEAGSEEQAIDKAYRIASKMIKQQDDFFLTDAQILDGRIDANENDID